MIALERVVAALEARGCRPKKNGAGWSACCPSHNDQNPSLSFSNGAGKVKLYCHAGCTCNDVVLALGLTLADLFDDAEKVRPREVAVYHYTDEHGAPLYRVIRCEPKGFRQERHSNGTWVGGAGCMKGVRRVIYNLPAVLAVAADGGRVLVCEGEKDCDRFNHDADLADGSIVATCNPGGTGGGWRDEYSAALKGAHVVVVADKDSPGRKHAEAVARSVRPHAASLRVVEAAKGKDLFDHLEAGLGLEDLVPLEPRPAPAPETREPTVPDGRPTIVADTDITTTVNAAEAALVAAEAPLFVRSGMLVRVARGCTSRARDLHRPDGAPVIEAAPEDYIRELLGEVAAWQEPSPRRGTDSLSPCRPPVWVVQTLAARGTWQIGPLDSVTTAPTFLHDGTIVERPGYHRDLGLLYEPARTYPPVPEAPDLHDATAAAAELLAPITDFPFASDADRSATLAAILTAAARDAIPGATPLFAIIGNVPGCGKGLLAATVSQIATGRGPALMPPARQDDEIRKRILGIGLAGDRVVTIDNIEGSFGSPSFAAALTSTTFSDRLLGVQRNVTVRLGCTWLCTGNNVQFRGDLGRRVVPIYLNSPLEHPEDREDFRIADLAGWVDENHPRLLRAALTVLRAYHRAGRPRHGAPALGSFESWDALIRGALIWTGLPDPLSQRAALRESSDLDLDTLRAAAGSWYSVFGDAEVTLGAALKRARELPTSDLLDPLAGLANRLPDKLDARGLGFGLRAVRDRSVSVDERTLRFTRSHRLDRNGVASWSVVVVRGPR